MTDEITHWKCSACLGTGERFYPPGDCSECSGTGNRLRKDESAAKELADRRHRRLQKQFFDKLGRPS